MPTADQPAVTGPGFYEMDAEHYHSDPAPKPSLSSGMLATIVTGTIAAAREAHPRLGPPAVREDNRKFDLGTVAHTLVLGKGREIDVIDADAWTTKAAKEQRADSLAAGRSPVLAKVFEKAEAMRVALFHQLADLPDERDTFSEAGAAEQAGFWQEPVMVGGVQRQLWGRMLADWRSLDTGRVRIRDYKTYAGQNGADPDGFVRGLISSGRDVQDPWYSRGAAAIAARETGEILDWLDVDFRFIVQDPEPPYNVAVVELDDRRWSGERCRWAIDRWVAAGAANLFRGHAPIVHYVAPPTYARIQWEERMRAEFDAEEALRSDGRRALDLLDPEEYAVPDPDRIQGEAA